MAIKIMYKLTLFSLFEGLDEGLAFFLFKLK